MHTNILANDQRKLLPLLKQFSGKFFLAGGTAIALQIGHRKSIDFDLFTRDELGIRSIVNQINRAGFDIEQTFVSTIDEYTAIINGVKVSFASYPFPIVADVDLGDTIKIRNLL